MCRADRLVPGSAIPTILAAGFLVFLIGWTPGSSASAQSCDKPVLGPAACESFPPPSSMPLQDYERLVLLPWLQSRCYADQGWALDKEVRNTGPFAKQVYYGIHPAVRIFYSPGVIDWLEGDIPEIPDGAVIVKEMFTPPADIYHQIREHGWFQDHPEQYQELLAELLTSWTVMIKDRGGDSYDGWFWAGPAALAKGQDPCKWLEGNSDDYSHVFFNGFGLGTCARCHSSAAEEQTFSDLRNIFGFDEDEQLLRFRTDKSWRDAEYLDLSKSFPVYTIVDEFLTKSGDPERQRLLDQLDLPAAQRPWMLTEAPTFQSLVASDPQLEEELMGDPALSEFVSEHTRPPVDPDASVAEAEAYEEPLPLFLRTFDRFPKAGENIIYPPVPKDDVRVFPSQWADHVFPGQGGPGHTTDSADQFITSNNCMGCHGGLGGSPTVGTGYQVNMFLKTGPDYGDGYNISEFGEWRWSPMGLAGRDPIFHAQLESEMILLLKNGNELQYPGWTPDERDPLHGTVEENQIAVINTCLSCHGAQGQRQLKIDAHAGRELPDGTTAKVDFNPDYFYLQKALTQEQLDNPPQPFQDEPNPSYEYDNDFQFYSYHRYGELAREGISCTVCHHINGPATTPEGELAFAEFLESVKTDPERKDWLPDKDGRLWPDLFAYFLAEDTTGQFERGYADELNGPFDDVTGLPMEHALGIKPVYNEFTADSDMCGTCHTINLPNIGDTEDEYPVLREIENNATFKNYNHSIEQATYLEWVNSKFGPGELNRTRAENPDFQSCQDCHMPNRFRNLTSVESPDDPAAIDIDPLVSQIASIQDSTYPFVDNSLPAEDLHVPERDDYRRHELVGLNAFMVEMSRQFPDIIGVATTDYETGADNGADLAIENMVLSAKEGRVVTLDVSEPDVTDDELTTTVTVTNQAGHRFPSGVAFRRAFIEFAVLDAEDNVLWVSGDTNEIGLLLDGETDEVLDTEFLDVKEPGNTLANYQPHYQVITKQDQVQIYEELVTNADWNFTTSFIHRVHHVKDNRLLPQGWVPAKQFAQVKDGKPVQGEVIYQFFEATDADGPSVVGGKPLIGSRPLDNDGDPSQTEYRPDTNYTTAGPQVGSDSLVYRIPLTDIPGEPAEVRVTVYSQALMPAWLHQRFELAAQAKAAGLNTPETDRLYYIASHLNLEGTVLEGWKLPIRSETVAVSQ